MSAQFVREPGMTFREISFGSAEYERERALRQEILRAPLGLSMQDEDLDQERGQFHFGLFDTDGGLLGCAIAVPLSATEAKVRQMAVAAARQRMGLGSRIVSSLESELMARGFTQVVLHARATAVGFYRRLGYSVVGAEFIEVTIPHRKMTKTIR